MVPDSELTKRLREILTTSDLNTTSAGAVRRQLETDLGVDLSDRKKFISQLIDDIIQNENQQEQEEDVEVEAEAEVENEDEDEDEDEDKSTSSQRSSSPKKKKRASGFTKICSISPQLELFFGVSQMARTEVVKKLWAYIRENHLQDPKDKRNIKCDDELHSIFRVPKINMFQMNKALSKHIWPLEETETNANHECSASSPSHPLKKQKRPKQEDDTDEDKTKPKAKRQKGATSGFLKPLHLSDSFVKFLGTGETTLPRTEAVKRIWEYIKLNDLQDPSDKRRILCDEKLKQLFEVDTFIGFSMTKYLKPHLIKAEQ